MTEAVVPSDLYALADVLRTLGHETRLKLIVSLFEHGEKSVGEIEALTGVGQPALSQQLALLRKAQLVGTRRAAKQVYYSLAPQAFASVAAFLSALAGKPTAAAVLPNPADASPPARGSAAMFAQIL